MYGKIIFVLLLSGERGQLVHRFPQPVIILIILWVIVRVIFEMTAVVTGVILLICYCIYLQIM
ncbi:GYPA isoform 1, partial [Pan troglodytes]